MLKIFWKRGEIATISTIFSYLMLDIYVKTRIRFSLRDKWLFEITEVEITRVDCSFEHTQLNRVCCFRFFGVFLASKGSNFSKLIYKHIQHFRSLQNVQVKIALHIDFLLKTSI